MYNAKDLGTITLTIVLAGMLIGVGVLIFDSFLRTDVVATTTTASDIIVLDNNTAVALTNGNLTTATITLYVNASGTGFNVLLTEDSNFTVNRPAGNITLIQATYDGNNSQVNYTYNDYSSNTGTALTSIRSAVGGIATSWLSLIITVAVLAIILGIVISNYHGKR